MKIDWSTTRVKIGMAGRNRHRAGVTNDGWGGYYTDHAIWLICSGEGQLKMQHGWQPLYPGICLWARPWGEYRLKYNPDNPIGNYFIHFDLLDSRGHPLPSNVALPPPVLHPPDPRALEANVRRIVYLVLHAQHEEIMARAPLQGPEQDVATALLSGLLRDLDAQSDGDYGATDPLSIHHRDAMTEAITRLSETPSRQPVIADLAKNLGYGSEHFRRVFKRIIGQTPQAYAVGVRMRHATDLLHNPNLPVTEIAEQTGYESIYAFSRQFKRSTGMSPTAYRESQLPREQDGHARRTAHA